MAETGSGIRVRLRRMAGSYPGSRGSGMGGLTENDDSCRLERLDGGVEWSPLRVILYIYIYMRVCAETWDSVGGEGDGQLAEMAKEKKKERKGSSERSHRPVLYWFVGVVVVVWSISCKMQCNASK